jgi:hypothetical protein
MRPPPPYRPLNRRAALIGLAAIVAVIVVLRLLAGANPEIVEHGYSRPVYPRIAAILTALTDWTSFSIAEIVILLLILSGLVALVRGIRRALHAPAPFRAFADGFLRIAIGCVLAYLVFLLLWGFNYQRLPLAASVGLDIAPPRSGELAALVTALVDESERLRPPVPEDEAGVARVQGGITGALDRASLGYDALDDQWPLVSGDKVLAKKVLLSPALARLGISGIFMPFTGEANVDTTLPQWTLPFVAAHEVAHQRGFAREDEANFLAYASCAVHPDATARYSSALEASLYALAALRAVDPAAHAALSARRGPAVKRDLEALEQWRRKYESRASAVHERVNDAYLRAQGQDGVTSYGRMVDLLLAERRAR